MKEYLIKYIEDTAEIGGYRYFCDDWECTSEDECENCPFNSSENFQKLISELKAETEE